MSNIINDVKVVRRDKIHAYQPCYLGHRVTELALGESDKIVSFLTESHGKLTGIAKGAKRSKKRFVNSLEPFSFVSLNFQDRSQNSLAFILSCELQKSYKNLIASLEKITFASYYVEITEGLIGEREENRLVFDHLNKKP